MSMCSAVLSVVGLVLSSTGPSDAAQYQSGEGDSWPTEEDEYVTDNRGEKTLLQKLDLVNTHVCNLIYAFNGTTMFYNDLVTLKNMAEEMKTIHDEIHELKYSDQDMKILFKMSDEDIRKAKSIYFDTVQKLIKLTDILQSFRNP